MKQLSMKVLLKKLLLMDLLFLKLLLMKLFLMNLFSMKQFLMKLLLTKLLLMILFLINLFLIKLLLMKLLLVKLLVTTCSNVCDEWFLRAMSMLLCYPELLSISRFVCHCFLFLFIYSITWLCGDGVLGLVDFIHSLPVLQCRLIKNITITIIIMVIVETVKGFSNNKLIGETLSNLRNCCN